MYNFRCALSLVGSVAVVLSSSIAIASESKKFDYPNRLLWGDTHLHSCFSADANNMGNVTLGPADAYRFARGESILTADGLRVQLSQPLDFLVVSDHAEFLGAVTDSRNKGMTDQMMDLSAKLFYTLLDMRPVTEAADSYSRRLRHSTWSRSIAAAEEANVPGLFTALSGFEWTSMPGGDNLHRVVMFRDGVERTQQTLPFSTLESHDPRNLWAYLKGYEESTGGRALAIPHNGNVSNGRMFSPFQYSGEPIDADYAKLRMRFEPVVEVTQIKGDGESHPFLSPTDEFSDFGTWDKGNLGAQVLKENDMLQYEYARSALKWGLKHRKELGKNPFQFGMIGSTDAHTSLATADDNNFWGKGPNFHPTTEHRFKGPFMVYRSGTSIKEAADWMRYQPKENDVTVESWEQLASGYAAVWATENTREAIFDAFLRREVYATTGPRIAVRFFAGWDFKADDDMRSDYVEYAYRHGVSMGAILDRRESSGSKHNAPHFIVAAQRDVNGANLDRVQIIKGWMDQSGEMQERVYDVAWSGKRRIRRGKLSPVGNTVDLERAEYSNDIGAGYLSTVWKDPDFDPNEHAFYYVRVLEIPTPTWVAYDEALGMGQFPKEALRMQQERAYTSPIWYEPEQ